MAELTPEERQKITAYLSHPLDFPPKFKDWIADWYALNTPKINLQQIFGFQIWSIHSATEVTADESTSSTSYTDLTTVGPTLDNLPNGFYIVMFGADVKSFVSGQPRIIGLSIDGAAPVSADEAVGDSGAVGKVSLLDLSQGTGAHSLKLKYKVTTGTYSFRNRWLHALKVVTE